MNTTTITLIVIAVALLGPLALGLNAWLAHCSRRTYEADYRWSRRNAVVVLIDPHGRVAHRTWPMDADRARWIAAHHRDAGFAARIERHNPS